MRPIDADALIKKYGDWYVEEGTESGFIGTLENLLATEPTIQPQSTTGQLNDGARSTAQSTDLIDRQAAIDALDCINGTEEVLRSLPSAQPEPKEGEWVDGRCNKCGGQAPFWIMSSTHYESDFCPCCGAKMKGERQK